jgi:hypothetical protein
MPECRLNHRSLQQQVYIRESRMLCLPLSQYQYAGHQIKFWQVNARFHAVPISGLRIYSLSQPGILSMGTLMLRRSGPEDICL